MFIVLLGFSGYLATKCVFLTNEPCMIRSTLIDLKRVEVNYYSFMITLDKCSESCNGVDDLTTEMCVPSKTKGKNLKVFNMITRINEAKTMIKIHYVIANANLIVQHAIQIKNGIMINVNVSVKRIIHSKKIIAGILAHVFVRMVRI